MFTRVRSISLTRRNKKNNKQTKKQTHNPFTQPEINQFVSCGISVFYDWNFMFDLNIVFGSIHFTLLYTHCTFRLVHMPQSNFSLNWIEFLKLVNVSISNWRMVQTITCWIVSQYCIVLVFFLKKHNINSCIGQHSEIKTSNEKMELMESAFGVNWSSCHSIHSMRNGIQFHCNFPFSFLLMPISSLWKHKNQIEMDYLWTFLLKTTEINSDFKDFW